MRFLEKNKVVVMLAGLALFGMTWLSQSAQAAAVDKNEARAEITQSKTVDFGFVAERGRSYSKNLELEPNADESELHFVAEFIGEGRENFSLVGVGREFTVAPSEARTLLVRTFVPETAEAKSYYGQLKLTSERGDELYDLRLDVLADEQNADAVVMGGKIALNTPVLQVSDVLKLRSTMQNAGSKYGFNGNYSLTVSVSGERETLIAWAGELKPDSQVDFAELLGEKAKLGYGLFQLREEYSYLQKNGERVTGVTTRSCLLLPWWSFVVVGAIIGLIVMLMVLIKHRKQQNKGEEF